MAPSERDILDPEKFRIVEPAFQTQGVKTPALPTIDAAYLQVVIDACHDAMNFYCTNRIEAADKIVPKAIADLNEDQDVALKGDNVDFAHGATIVSLDDAQSMSP